MDVVEELARERAKELFGCEYANVQPHSGAQANMAVQFAILKPGDTVMGMNLDHGGHLTHGSPVNFSGTYFHIVPYGVNDEGFIDYDKVEEIAMECKPKMIIAGASAYARTIDFKRFREIADACGAVLMVDMAHIAGLVAAGLHPSPIPYAHVVTTTTHKTLRGPRGGMILSSQEIADKYNFNKAIFPGIQGGPLMHVIAAKAVCFKEALQPEFKVSLGMNELVANIFSWILAVLFAFFTNRIWVFDGKTNGAKEFFVQMMNFFGGRVATLVVEEVILFVFITKLGFGSMVVKIAAQIIVIVLNYVISKLWVFRK